MSVQASEVVAAIEQMSKASLKGLEDAFLLVQRIETTRAAEISTAQDALGPAYAATVVELARVTTAERTTELLVAIRDLAGRLLGGAPSPMAAPPAATEAVQPVREQAPAVVEPQALSRQRVFTPPQPRASTRDELYGVPFPSSRREEAEDVVVQARKALAQGHKTNPFESYRGKNQWCKKLFDMAFAALSSGETEETVSEPAVVAERPATPPVAAVPERDPAPAPPPVPSSRSSVSMSGPARGVRNRFGPPVPPAPATTGSIPRDPSSGRRFGMGVVTQTIDPEGGEPSAPTRESFYKRKR
ncbi:hypothetical protein [Rhizobium leguminosarum]|uniref:hypothetical protein n=1 Tax=Rhizobium leguminosarum TaxID=384 RepID=UPI002E128150|nr:hypothetical protein U8Q02_36325 [Rhizobium leguminosarum]